MTATTEATPATMTDDWFLRYEPEVARIALREHKKSTIFALEDMEQAIWEHAIKKWKDYATADEKLVYSLMRRAAIAFATRQRIDYMYATGAFIYTPALVSAYLETCAWQPLEEVPDIDARVDMLEAFNLLRASAPKQADAIFKRFGMGEGDILSSAERVNVSRGVESICHRLNSGLRLSAESIDLVISEEN